VVLWEMLTGVRMFEGETLSHTLAHVLTRDVKLEDVPAPVRPLLARCLDRNVKTRLRDVGEARVAIDFNVTRRATGDWIVQQLREALPEAAAISLRDLP